VPKLKLVDENADSSDLIRRELADAIADHKAKQAAAASARAGVKNLEALVEVAQKRLEVAKNETAVARAEYIQRLTEAAESGQRLRPPETPLSQAKLVEQDDEEELLGARAALRNVEERLAEAQSDARRTQERADEMIKQLFALNMPRRIEEAKRAHDVFMAKTLVLSKISNAVSVEIYHEVRSLRNKAENAGFAFDNDFVSAEAAAWEKVPRGSSARRRSAPT
jgi:hypothetical protein